MTTENSYNGNVYVKRDGVVQNYTAHELNEYIRCRDDVAYFCEHYVKVISLDRGLVPFKLRGYQTKMVQHFNDNKFNIVLACRQSGKCVTGDTKIKVKFLDSTALRIKIKCIHDIFYVISKQWSSWFYKYNHDGTTTIPYQQILSDILQHNREAAKVFDRFWRGASYNSKIMWWSQLQKQSSESYIEGALHSSSITNQNVYSFKCGVEKYANCISHDDNNSQRYESKEFSNVSTVKSKLDYIFISNVLRGRESVLWDETRNSSSRNARKKSYGRDKTKNFNCCQKIMGGSTILQENEIAQNQQRFINREIAVAGTQRCNYSGITKSIQQRICFPEFRKNSYGGNSYESEQENEESGYNRYSSKEFKHFNDGKEMLRHCQRENTSIRTESSNGYMPALRKNRKIKCNETVAFQQLPSTKKFIESFEGVGFFVESDTGYHPIKQAHKTIKYEIWKIQTKNGCWLSAADNHIVFNDVFEECFIKNLCVGDIIQTKQGPSKIIKICNTHNDVHMFDVGVDSDNHRYYTNDILSHNSITSVAWLLHYVIFNSEKKIGMLANKGATAREMLARLTLMLENLPFFLQPGCKVLNKGSIKFSNNSEVIAAATSSSSIRGLSLNCVTGDTKICIYENDSIYHLEIDNFINKSKLVQKDVYYTVYKITNKINNKIYVGFHSTYNIDDGYMGSGKLIKGAIEKYGIDQFTKEILGIYNTKEEAEAEEKRIVNRDFTLREDTYNLSVGGNICILHGKNNGFYGKKHSAESREKISKAQLGRILENAHKIIHNDGRIFHTIEKAIEELGYLETYNNYASRVKVIYECGNPYGFLRYECPDIQQSAYEFYLKRNEMLENLPETRKATGRIVSEKLKGRAKPAGFGEKISKALSGIPKSPEHVEKVNRNPEKIRKSAEKHRGMKRSDEAKIKMSHAKKGMVAKNKGKKFFTDPTDPSKKGYYFEHEVPLGWVNKMMKK